MTKKQKRTLTISVVVIILLSLIITLCVAQCSKNNNDELKTVLTFNWLKTIMIQGQ